MAAEVFSGQPATYFGEDDALVPKHDWDTPLSLPEHEKATPSSVSEEMARSLGSKAHFLDTEWGPSISPRAGHVKAPEYPPEYMQQ